MSAAAVFYLVLALIALVLLSCYYKAGKLLKCVLFTAFTGVGTLGVLWLLGFFINIPLSITPLTVAVSGVMGIPGIVAMLIFYLI